MASQVYFARLKAEGDGSAIARVQQLFDAARFARLVTADANTLYTGSRQNAIDHMNTAIAHGFDYAVVGAPLIIADGLAGEWFGETEIGKKHFTSVKIAGGILSAPSMIVMSHFKGHGLAGFGGAIKNLGMGCAPSAGKIDQHKGCLLYTSDAADE